MELLGLEALLDVADALRGKQRPAGEVQGGSVVEEDRRGLRACRRTALARRRWLREFESEAARRAEEAGVVLGLVARPLQEKHDDDAVSGSSRR